MQWYVQISIGGVRNTLLYKNVDMVDTGSLPGVKKSDWDDKMHEISTSRQERLLQTLVKVWFVILKAKKKHSLFFV